FVLNVSAYNTMLSLSLLDALPISGKDIDSYSTRYGGRRPPVPRHTVRRTDDYRSRALCTGIQRPFRRPGGPADPDDAGIRPDRRDRKSTRLNSSHVKISYAVFCLE